MKITKRRLLAALLGATLLVTGAACGSDDDDHGGGTTPTVEDRGSGANGGPSDTSTDTSGTGAVEQSSSEVQSAIFGDSPSETPTDTVAVENYLTAIIENIDVVWTGWFTERGYREPFVGFEIVQPDEQPYQTNCTDGNGNPSPPTGSDHPNAFYCDRDQNSFGENGMIVLPAVTFGNMWSGNIFGSQVADPAATGDFAAAYLAAHEFSHHVAFELSTQTGVQVPANPNGELLADCLAGVYADSLWRGGNLEDGDIPEALNAAQAIGDYEFNDPGHHGTPQERMDAFWVGWAGRSDETLDDDGIPANCFQDYWPEFANSGNPQ